MTYAKEIENSVTYLNSDAAAASLRRDIYWPKWDSPWWHMLTLHEMGEAKRIPKRAIDETLKALENMPLKFFPFGPSELPPGANPQRDFLCHCAVGSIYQVLAANGVDVDTAAPWLKPWMFKYQMSDGGLTCDNDAYLVKGEVPSSMVGLIACFEAVLFYTQRPWTAEEENFLERGAKFLMRRKLIHGSETKFNASERDSAKHWAELCFPRFYYYDILRGLNALTGWSEITGRPLPEDSIREAVTALEKKSAQGDLRCERLSFAGITTLLPDDRGGGIKHQPATLFPLLEATSALGKSSPFLTRQWVQCKRRLSFTK